MIKDDRVIYTSRRYVDSSHNPLWNGQYGKIVGTITSVSEGEMCYSVKWDNENHNYYRIDDLTLYENKETGKKKYDYLFREAV